MQSVRLYLVRHGESEVNLTRTFSYKRVDQGLTPRGVEQARALAAWFSRTHSRSAQPIARVYSSPLKRGLDTAQLIAEATRAPLEVAEALRELNCGSLEGRNDDQAWAEHDEVWHRWRQGQPEAAFPQGENFLQVQERVMGFLEEVSARHANEDVVAVGHGGIFCSVLPGVCPIPWDPTTPLTLANTSVTIFRRDEVFTCEQWNGLEHLPSEPQ